MSEMLLNDNAGAQLFIHHLQGISWHRATELFASLLTGLHATSNVYLQHQ